MPDSPGSAVNPVKPDHNANAPPGGLDASNRPERSAETEVEHETEVERIRRLTEQALATAGAPGTAFANAIMSPFEGSDGNKMADDNLTVDEKLPEKIHDEFKRIARAEAAVAANTVLQQLA